MSSTDASRPDSLGANALLTSDELNYACQIEVYDHTGNKVALGDLVKEKRSVLIFTRHFCVL